MTSLENLIHNKKIKFQSYMNKIDTNIGNYGKNNQKLIKHIIEKTGNYIIMSGKGLEEYLKDTVNIYDLTDFLVQIYFVGNSREYPKDISIHVAVDINKLKPYYVQPKEDLIINGLGKKVGDAASWMPKMSYFEKLWNMALCNSIGGFIGSPGYEYPLDEESFKYEIINHALKFMIGTKKQLQRYKKYARESLASILKIADELRNDPESIFTEDILQLVNINDIKGQANNIEKIVNNLSRFSKI